MYVKKSSRDSRQDGISFGREIVREEYGGITHIERDDRKTTFQEKGQKGRRTGDAAE